MIGLGKVVAGWTLGREDWLGSWKELVGRAHVFCRVSSLRPNASGSCLLSQPTTRSPSVLPAVDEAIEVERPSKARRTLPSTASPAAPPSLHTAYSSHIGLLYLIEHTVFIYQGLSACEGRVSVRDRRNPGRVERASVPLYDTTAGLAFSEGLCKGTTTNRR